MQPAVGCIISLALKRLFSSTEGVLVVEYVMAFPELIEYPTLAIIKFMSMPDGSLFSCTTFDPRKHHFFFGN
jgi:hypothetical protein